MDSKVVNRAIKTSIWPSLEQRGFNSFSTRTAWRHIPDQIDVVNFQSFNSHNASVLGCTTFSFAVNLGRYFLYIPDQYGPGLVKEKKGVLLPDESQCHMRGRVVPRRKQTLVNRLLQKRSQDFWSIEPDGGNLGESIAEVDILLCTEAMSWFQQLDAAADVLRILEREEERMGELWGFGRNPSPIRSYFSGYCALKVGRNDLAVSYLQAAGATGCFSAVSSQLATDIAKAAQPFNQPDAAR